MDAHARYPAIVDLRRAARDRIPHFVWEYLDSATGTEATLARSRAAFDAVTFTPSILHGEVAPDLSTTLLGHTHPLPVGIAPVGMSGLVWPGAERQLARFAARAGLPYTLSTVATRTPEDLSRDLGDHAWFQIYPPRDPAIRADMLERARNAGFSTLVLTVDVPVASRRERQTRGGLTQPPRLSPRLALQAAMRPAWLAGIAATGMPRMRLIDQYAAAAGLGTHDPRASTAHVGYLLRTAPDWDYLAALRDAWDGSLVVKGVLDAATVPQLQAAGVDAVWVSSHAGRQFDAAPAALDVLPGIRAATDLPLIFDTGVEGGLDILRAMALGADFVMLGRAWHYALAALGPDGPAHAADILQKDLEANLGQMGLARPQDAHTRLCAAECSRTFGNGRSF